MGSCPPCIPPPCAGSCLCGSCPRLPILHQAGLPGSTLSSIQHCPAQCHCGLDLTSMGWCMMGIEAMGLRDTGTGSLGPLIQDGELGDALRVVAMQGLILSLLSCPSCGSPPAPGVHRGLPQQKVRSGPHGIGAAEGYSARHSSINPAPLQPLSPALQSHGRPGIFVGVILATLEGAPCNLGSWQPGVKGSSTGCGKGLRAWLCPHKLCHGIQHQPEALCPRG